MRTNVSGLQMLYCTILGTCIMICYSLYSAITKVGIALSFSTKGDVNPNDDNDNNDNGELFSYQLS